MVRRRLEDEGWGVVRAAGSLGDADLVAGRMGQTVVIEVKSDLEKYGPYNNFGPKSRGELLALARKTGWEPWLIYWPPRGNMQWLGPEDWPRS